MNLFTLQMTIESFGEVQNVALVEDGANRPVTKENRYVANKPVNEVSGRLYTYQANKPVTKENRYIIYNYRLLISVYS